MPQNHDRRRIRHTAEGQPPSYWLKDPSRKRRLTRLYSHGRSMGNAVLAPTRAVTSWRRTLRPGALTSHIPGNPPFFAVFVAAFAALTLVGTVVLLLPVARVPGQSTTFADALFTASSAVSCTGLAVLDTATHWSLFGQATIFMLIQLGGFGFMLISAFLIVAFAKRVHILDFRFKDALDTYTQPAAVRFTLQTVGLVVLFQGLGTLLLYLRFGSIMPSHIGPWQAVFHAVSAFNNCGFSILSGDNLRQFYTDDFALLVVSALVILGSLGTTVIIGLLASRSWLKLNVNSRIAVVFTFGLLIAGTLGILAVEYGNSGSLGPMSVPQKMVHAFYISANARTAGFSSLNLGNFAFQTLALVMILMFIGGVAGSTAGGIKVNTFATLLVTVRSYVMGNSHVRIFGRVIPEQRVHEAIAVLFLSACVVGLPFLILTFTESLPKLDLLFESVSAFGTVGLTTGITPSLSVAGRVVVAVCMFVGRLGPLTMLLAVTERHVAVEDFEPEDRA